MKQKQSAAQKQTQRLSPFQRQSLAVLSLNMRDLNELIAGKLEENPLLEGDWNGVRYNEPDAASIESYTAQKDDPLNDLTVQFHIVCSEPSVSAIGDFLIQSLDEHGYLDTSIDEAATHLHISPKRVKQALKILQTLEPAGVGARDLRESLSIQLRRQERPNRLAMEIVRTCFDELVCKAYATIAQTFDTSEREVLEAVADIRMLNPYPFNGMDAGQQVKYVIPELYVYLRNGDPSVALIQRTPALFLTLSPTVLAADEETRLWAKDYVTEAQQLIWAVNRRQQTLLSIGKSIAAAQRTFFINGSPPISLVQERIAADVELSISTVSRAIKEQYLQFNRKIYPLKYFFPSHISAGGSREQIKAMILSVIASESPDKPVSDGQIARYLASVGQPAERRTVTKYRHELGIPQASQRHRP